jgi:hypothetical protein
MSDDIEQSFFKLAEFENFKGIYHNLKYWNISIESWENKAGQIEAYFVVPFSEMTLEINEIQKDINFFDKHTARIKLSINKSNQNYIFHERVKCTFTENVKFILIDTHYVYPHNWYYIYNREYLRDKVIFSIDYIENFFESYKSIFNSNVPYIYIKKINETSKEYEFEIIIKEYLDMFYVSTDIESATNYLNLLCDSNVNNEKPIKYKKINLKIPRLVKDRKNKFKFVPGNWRK